MSSFCEGCLSADSQRSVTAVPGLCPASSSVGSSGGSVSLSSSAQSSIPFGMPNVVAPQMDAAMFEYMRSIGELVFYKQLCRSYYAALQSTSRCASTVASSAASINSNDSVASSSSVNKVSKLPGGFKTVRDKLMTAVGDKRKAAKVYKSVEAYGDGYCYLHAIRPHARASFASILGSWPTVSSMLKHFTLASLLPASDLRAIGVQYGNSTVHVGAKSASYNFFSMLTSLRSLVGHSDGVLSIVGKGEACDPVHLACKIGGEETHFPYTSTTIPADYILNPSNPVVIVNFENSVVPACDVLHGDGSLVTVSYGDALVLDAGQRMRYDEYVLGSATDRVIVIFSGKGDLRGARGSQRHTISNTVRVHLEESAGSECSYIVSEHSALTVLRSFCDYGVRLESVSDYHKGNNVVHSHATFKAGYGTKFTDDIGVTEFVDVGFPFSINAFISLASPLKSQMAFSSKALGGFSDSVRGVVCKIVSIDAENYDSDVETWF